MPSQVTVTGKVGPAITVTSKVISNVKSVEFQLDGTSQLRVEDTSGQIQYIDISGATTLTGTIASGVVTLVVS